jgi:hypothetical protein
MIAIGIRNRSSLNSSDNRKVTTEYHYRPEEETREFQSSCTHACPISREGQNAGTPVQIVRLSRIDNAIGTRCTATGHVTPLIRVYDTGP